MTKVQELQQQLLKEILERKEEPHIPNMDLLVEAVLDKEDYTSMWVSFYVYSLNKLFNVNLDILKEFLSTSGLFEVRQLANNIFKETGYDELLSFYESEIKYRYQIKRMNAVEVLESILRESELAMAELSEGVKTLANLKAE